MFCSPRQRAKKTLELLLLGGGGGGDGDGGEMERERERMEGRTTVTTTEEIAEWGYGDYEGLTTTEIREGRRGRGLDGGGGKWDIWRDGCEGGE